jgi:hypothetical protein
MRKFFGSAILVLITALLMLGCGVGGGGSAANPVEPPVGATGDGSGNNPATSGGGNFAAGYLVINFVDGQAHLRAASSSLPLADHVRIIVRKIDTVDTPEYDDDGNLIETTLVSTTTYKQIVDIAVPGTGTITLPPADGYTVDVLSYLAGTRNLLLKSAQTPGVNIVSGVTTSLDITLLPIDTTITPPGADIASRSSYQVTINNNVFPLRSDKKNLKVSDAAITTILAYASGEDDSFLRTAPSLSVTDTNHDLFFQGLFFVDPALLNSDDVWSNWIYCYPNPTFSTPDPDVKVHVTPPGQISINITL